ncbi:hypothetical protein ACJJTC_005340 [Scirpophaga incertulas]
MDVEFLRYQFQDGCDGVVTKKGFMLGIRHLQIVYMMACTAAMAAIRGSIGIAVIAINDQERLNDTYIQIHSWDRRIQGTVLSSFFFGYALVLVPAELIIRNLNGKAVITTILAVNGVLCLVMPIIVSRGGWIAVCNALFMMGMTQACLHPANQKLLADWIPPNEMYLCSSLVYGGMQLGILVSLPVAGILAEARLGWELIFYSLAMMLLSMAIICGLLTASSPDKHQAVGDSEKEYVREALSYCKKRCIQMPWRRVLKTRQFWGVTCAHAAVNAIVIFYLADVPAYLRMLNISIKDCGLYTMLTFASKWAMFLSSSPTLDWLSGFSYFSHLFSVTYFRKLINACGAFGAVIGLSILPNLVPDWSNFAIVVLSAILASVGFQLSGFLKSIRDMSENHSGTLLMMTSSVASVVGALTPLMSGFIIADEISSLKKWRIVILIIVSLYVVSNVMYSMFGSGQRQDWDYSRNRQKFGYHNGGSQRDTSKSSLGWPDIVMQVRLINAGQIRYI